MESMQMMDVDKPKDKLLNPNIRLKALSRAQERRLIGYLDDRWLEFTRNFKKRSDPSSKLPTLKEYLEEARHLLSFVLQIPPIDPSTALRLSYMLRLTGDVLGSIPGYSLTRRIVDQFSPLPTEDGPQPVTAEEVKESLRDLLDFLDDLDQAWETVLEGQAWDPSTAEGVDLTEAIATVMRQVNGANAQGPIIGPALVKTSPPTATDVARLRSLIVGGESAIEEWLINDRISALAGASGSNEDDLPGMLDRLGMLDEFDNLFTRTMDHLGFQDIKPDDLKRREEVPMSHPFPDEKP